jgi:molecular chaperone DnaK (HSP70)
VYDLGGGTFDISILKLQNGIFEVLATNGNTHLGGDDFDRRLADTLLEAVRREAHLDLEQYPDSMQALRLEAERAKIRLSDETTTTVALDLAHGSAPFKREVTRAELENLTHGLVESTLQPCRQALKDAGLQPADIDEVVLVGGATRMPMVRRRVQELFGKVPHSHLNPDEVVALGAAVQADILSGGTQDMLLLDVTPLSLGIETMGGVMSTLIRRNTTIPTSAKEMFTTSVDGQTGVDIHVLQGERELAKDNRSLARFQLKLPPLPASVPRIEVTFLIDANGILNVTARDVRTGQSQSLDVKPSSGLTDEEVERMIGDSFKFAAEDLKARQLIEARTEADAILRATEKARSRGSHLIGADEGDAIQAAAAALHTAIQGDDHRAIRARIADLERATHHLAEVLMDASLKEALENKKVSELP